MQYVILISPRCICQNFDLQSKFFPWKGKCGTMADHSTLVRLGRLVSTTLPPLPEQYYLVYYSGPGSSRPTSMTVLPYLCCSVFVFVSYFCHCHIWQVCAIAHSTLTFNVTWSITLSVNGCSFLALILIQVLITKTYFKSLNPKANLDEYFRDGLRHLYYQI